MRIVVLGGYGVFGRRICAGLANEPGIKLLIAGRQQATAIELAEQLRAGGAVAEFGAIDLDLAAPDFHQRLAECRAQLLIHAAGPFQTQDYRVAHAAIALGMHYIDLADSRAFVCGIKVLDQAARNAGVLVTSGASSVPALSAAVVQHLAADFSRVDRIDIGISPGHRTERGIATVRAILGQAGERSQVWLDGRWQSVWGWHGLHAVDYPVPVGRRWLANVDVPDLEILPQLWPTVRQMRFGAGLELPLLHFGLALLAGLRRWRLLPKLTLFARPALAIANTLHRYGSDCGAMHVALQGVDGLQRPLERRWTLLARNGDGPQVAASAAVALSRKLAAGKLHSRGAKAAAGLLHLADFESEFGRWSITTRLTG